ncbi:hypothetical protein D6817_01145 [Candidatus Pacearchaeota archaeon]|nr:MAG: hypothetical protein D6817_01145 [Candidatus Pacearchaeota archaeon]
MKKVVVIGGGFAGSLIAKKLEGKFEVTLVDTKDYFEFTPGILRSIVEPTHVKKIQVLHTHYLRKARVIVGRVSEVTKTEVKVGTKRLKYDYLAVCSGSHTEPPFKEHGIVLANRANELRECHSSLHDAKKVVIVGGGLVGVELAGEIAWKYPEKELTIIHAKPRLMERLPARAAKLAERYLTKKGVEIFYNERVEQIKDHTLVTRSRKKFKADMFFLCTGIKVNCSFMQKNFSSAIDERGRLKVDQCLRVVGTRNVFAAGDVNDCKVEKTAQNAELQAEVVVKNICALEDGHKMKEYVPKQTPLVISVGKWYGIFVKGNFAFGGIVPALMKGAIEKWEIAKKKKI